MGRESIMGIFLLDFIGSCDASLDAPYIYNASSHLISFKPPRTYSQIMFRGTQHWHSTLSSSLFLNTSTLMPVGKGDKPACLQRQCCGLQAPAKLCSSLDFFAWLQLSSHYSPSLSTAATVEFTTIPKWRVKSCTGKLEQACKNILISLCASKKETVHNSQEPTCSALG